MAALPRILQKVFGRTGDTAQFGQIGSDSAGAPALTKDLNAIQALGQFEAGLFSITGNLNAPPRGEDFNSLFYLITSQLKYLFQSGVPEWVSSEPYYANKSFAVGSDGNLYRSLTGSDVSPNMGNNPVGDATNWSVVWDKTNDGSGSGLDSDLVRGTTPGTRGLQYLAAAAVSNIAALILSDLKTVAGSGSGLDSDLVRGTTPGTRGLQYLAAAAVSNIAALILSDLKTVDGSGSGLDSDLVRGTTPGTRGLQYLAAAAVSNIAALILSDLKTVDGSGSGLDADLLDGQHGSYYAKVNTATSSTETDMPVGSHVAVINASYPGVNRNESRTLYLGTDGDRYATTGATALSGTWRCCGLTGITTGIEYSAISLFRRVA